MTRLETTCKDPGVQHDSIVMTTYVRTKGQQKVLLSTDVVPPAVKGNHSNAEALEMRCTLISEPKHNS